MTERYSQAEAVAAVARLTEARLLAFVQAEIIQPLPGPLFRQLDLVRMELLCDLTDQFDLAEDALALVISLIDQVHGSRAELRALYAAIAKESQDVRARLAAALHQPSNLTA